jgi:hypothetical protein
MVRGVHAHYCVNCDRDEATALDAEDEAAREREDVAFEERAGGCTCADFGDYQCDVHGPAIIAQQRAEWEQHEREQGRGRRGPYWRPKAARDKDRAAGCCDPLRGREAVLDLRAKGIVESPAGWRVRRDERRWWHRVLLAHLRERVALPGGER